MKAFLVVILCTLTVWADGLKIEHNFDKALQEAKKQHKQVMMMYSAVWCPECNYMKDVVFNNIEVASYLQNNYVILTLDIQKDKLPEGFDYSGIPVFFFLDSNAKEKNRIIGGSKATKFLQKLKDVK